ncbi:MAG: hypothetical protein IKP73_02265 [Bacteroidales bacterium]|nr:hypothetical protein [Bacteroidales bacterium]
MKILFEGFVYPTEILADVLKNELLFNSKGDATPFVGYFFDEESGDSVFILPKVFVNKDNLAFEKYNPLEIIDLSIKDNPLKSSESFAQIFELSVWLYKAIEKFNIRHPFNSVAKHKNIQNAVTHKGESSETYLDVILSLLDFYKRNRNLLTFVYKNSHSGNSRVNWNKTFSMQTPILQGDKPIYTEICSKEKIVDFDEQLLVLFYSSLEFLRHNYNFKKVECQGFNIIMPNRFKNFMASGKALNTLKKIRKNYFSDQFVKLWNLLYIFFEKSEQILNRRYRQELLLIKNFNEVFEDIIDCLIGDNDIPEGLKNQKDGKMIDHLYKNPSLTNSEYDIYFIGDSKYYKESTFLGENSIYKQFTYAKNVIQYNIDIFNQGKPNGTIRYRDPLTEGYDITPNFFIRGKVFDKSSNEVIVLDDTEHPINLHFENRLFDRDTLILQTYDINFLMVLSAYVLNGEDNFRAIIRDKFRHNIIAYFNQRYDFYKVYPTEDLVDFVNQNFRKYIGKMFHDKDENFVWFAFEKGSADFSQIKGVCSKTETILEV